MLSIKGVQAYAAGADMFLKNVRNAFDMSSAKPMEDIIAEMKKKGIREGTMIPAQIFSDSLTASEAAPGCKTRTQREMVIMPALKYRNRAFLIFNTPSA